MSQNPAWVDPLERLSVPEEERFPGFANNDETWRIRHGELRLRLLEGRWATDLLEALVLRMGLSRTELIRVLDMSLCVARDIWNQISAIYENEPNYSHPKATEDELDAIVDILKKARFRATMDAFQPQVIGLREGFVRISVVEEVTGRRINLEAIPASRIVIDAEDDNPSVPTAIAILKKATVQRKDVWVAEVMDPRVGRHEIVDLGHRPSDLDENPTVWEEINACKVLWTNPEGYPWRYKGKAFLPGELYHALQKHKRFDPYFGAELVDGTLNVGCSMTFKGHIMREGAYPQRNVADYEPVGGVQTDAAKTGRLRATVEVTPGSILRWRSKNDGKTGQFYQFGPGADVDEVIRNIQYDIGICGAAYGISPSDVNRLSTSQRTGVAVAITQDGIRKEIARYSPGFSESDGRLISTTAKCANLWLGYTGPVDDWSAEHQGLPLSVEEERLGLEKNSLKLSLQLASRVDIIVRDEGLTREAAIARVEQIDADNAKYPGVMYAPKGNPNAKPAGGGAPQPGGEPAGGGDTDAVGGYYRDGKFVSGHVRRNVRSAAPSA